jgi:predicted metal-dependent enzyme (double-stranded beta helix superfamily)
MLFSNFLSFAFTVFLFALPTTAIDKPGNAQLVADLKTSATMLDQLSRLRDDQLLYDFSTNPQYSWLPGSVSNANAATWPVLSTYDMTVAQLNFAPCAMLSPHLHRCTNLVVCVTGEVQTYMYQENGARLVEQKLTPGKMTVFPAASLHSMYNTGMHTVIWSRTR